VELVVKLEVQRAKGEDVIFEEVCELPLLDLLQPDEALQLDGLTLQFLEFRLKLPSG